MDLGHAARPKSRRESDGPPVFIVGCGRSGTTLLRLMLDTHGSLAIPGESHFIPPLYRARRRYASDGTLNVVQLAEDIMRTPHFRLWDIPKQKVRERVNSLQSPTFSGVVESVFRAYADHHGKTRWGDKTPIYVRSIPLLVNLYPQARFVHLIRDGRDVALSYLSVPWGPATVREAAYKWRRDTTAGMRFGRNLGPERYLEVRYEDLVADPRSSLQAICDFVDIEYSEDLLEHHRDAESRVQAPADGAPFHAAATRPPTSGLRDWRTQMEGPELRIFESIAGRVLAQLGYERRLETPSLQARARAGLTMARGRMRAAASRSKKAFIFRFTRRLPAGIEPY